MASKIKGITLEIGGDTTGLTKALSNVNRQTNSIQKELKDVESALKLEPDNVELVEQKQKLLNDAIETTQDKLAALKKAKEKADEDMANGTEINEQQYRLLQREIVNTQHSLEKLEKQSDEFNDSLGNVEKNKKSFGEFKSVLGGVTKGAAAFVAVGTAVAATLSEAEENTREYREDLNKLRTAFVSAEKDFSEGKKAYSDFYGLLGEHDRAIEAVNHLAELTNNQKELSAWTQIAAGVNAKFTDSLPIEGLTEAANETAKVGAVTGVLADALNWAGVSEEEFNKKLEKLNSEEERAQYITETLSGIYSETGKTYLETNASIIASREAQQQWNEEFARIGEIVAPIKTQVTGFGTDLLSSTLDCVEGIIKTKDESALLVEKIKEENDTWRNLIETQQEKAAANVAEIDYTTRLYNELKLLVDENGNITDKNRIRVEYILGELSEAIGIELKLTGDQIQGYKDLGASVDELLAKKRAEIILASQEETYKKAVSEIGQKQIEQSQLYASILEKEMEVKDANAKLTEYSTSQEKLSVLALQTQLIEMRDTYSENDAVINEYYANIADYENNYQAIMEGNADKIVAINSTVGESFKIAGEASEKELAKQVVVAGNNYAEIQKKVDEGVKGVTQIMADEALIQYQNAVNEYQKIGKAIPDGMQVGIENGKPALKQKISNFVVQIKSWFTGSQAFDTHSPSKWAGKIGKWIDEGLANEIVANIGLVKNAFIELFGTVEEEHEKLTAEEEKYNKELERIRTEGTEKENEEYLENLKKLAENAKERRKLIRETYKGMVDDVQKSIDKLDGEMSSYQKNLSSTDLTTEKENVLFIFNGKEYKETKTVLADLSKKRAELEKFIYNLQHLKEIGIDDTMLEQIRTLGGEKGGQLAQALLDATPEQRDLFVEDFKKIGELSGMATTEAFQSEIEGVAENTKATFKELNPDLLKIGEDWGAILGTGVLEKLKTTLSGVKEILGKYGVSDNLLTQSAGHGVNPKLLSNNTQIIQYITATPQTAFETSEATRRVMENIWSEAVLK